MKPFSLFFGFFVFGNLLANSGLAQQVCKINVNVANARLSPIPSGAGDLMSQRVARYLQDQNLDSSCLDLRSSGPSSNSNPNTNIYTIREQTVSILASEELSLARLQRLQSHLCEGAGSSCRVRSELSCLPNSSLRIVHDLRDGVPGASTNRLQRGTEREAALPGDQPLPRFSEACRTGRHQDSWNNAASTAASREYLGRLGLQVNEIRSMELKHGEESFWSFGFVNHAANGQQAPTHFTPRRGLVPAGN